MLFDTRLANTLRLYQSMIAMTDTKQLVQYVVKNRAL